MILGIGITYKDEVEERVFYDKVLRKDEDMRVPLRPIFNSSNIYIPIETDFTERIYIYQYYSYGDIMSSIGAMNAFILPVIAILTPYFIMYFLYSLSKMLKFKYQQVFH